MLVACERAKVWVRWAFPSRTTMMSCTIASHVGNRGHTTVSRSIAPVIMKTAKMPSAYSKARAPLRGCTRAAEVARELGQVRVIEAARNARPPVHQVEIVEKGLAIMGSYISNFTFPAAIRLVESGRLNLLPMITATIPLEETLAGIAQIRSGEAVKIVIKP